MKQIILLISIIMLSLGGLFANGQGEDSDAPPLSELGFHETGYPIVDTPVEIEILLPIRAQMKNIEDFTLPARISEKTGVNVRMNGIPQSIYTQKKNLLFASGDLPDVFWGTQSLTMDDLKNYGESGTILRLNDYIDNYMPNLKKILDEEPLYLKYMKDVNGNIYYLPFIVEDLKQPVQGKMYINKRWLDTLDLEIPETLEELTEVLRAFKERDPNRNGMADEIPLVCSDMAPATTEISSIVQLFGAFGRHGSGFILEGGKVVYAPVKREYLEGINYFMTYFKEGLTNSDAFFLPITDYWKVFKTSEDNMVGLCISFGVGDVIAERFQDDYVPLAPVNGPGGTRSWHSIYTTGFRSSVGAAVNGSTPYPEIVLRLLDEFYLADNSIQTYLGSEGDSLSKDAEGNYSFLEKGMDPWEMRYLYSPADGPIMIKKEYIESGKAPNLLQESADLYRQYYKDTPPSYLFPKVSYEEEELQYLRAHLVDIQNYVLSQRAEWFVSGKQVTDAEWDSYVGKIKRMGLEEIIRIKQAAFERADLFFREFE